MHISRLRFLYFSDNKCSVRSLQLLEDKKIGPVKNDLHVLNLSGTKEDAGKEFFTRQFRIDNWQKHPKFRSFAVIPQNEVVIFIIISRKANAALRD